MLATINLEVLATAHDYIDHVDDIFATLVKSDGLIPNETMRHALELRIQYYRGMMQRLPDILDAIQEFERLDELLEYVRGCELNRTITQQFVESVW